MSYIGDVRNESLKEAIEHLLTLGIEYGWRHEKTLAEQARIEKRYGDKMPMLMQIAGFRGDAGRKGD